MTDYYKKYLKYKTKYLSLKGGNNNIVTFDKSKSAILQF